MIIAVFDHLQYAVWSVLHTVSNLKLNGGKALVLQARPPSVW